MIEEYNPDWPSQYAEAAAALVTISNGRWLVEHVGPTAIEGLAAKPTIDLAVRIDQRAEIETQLPALDTLGWRDVVAGPRTHRVLAKRTGRIRTHIAHFFAADQWETCNQRIFRDWLQDNLDHRVLYERVKRTATEQATGGRDYTTRKTDVIQEIVDRARAARGVPPVDVWDK